MKNNYLKILFLICLLPVLLFAIGGALALTNDRPLPGGGELVGVLAFQDGSTLTYRLFQQGEVYYLMIYSMDKNGYDIEYSQQAMPYGKPAKIEVTACGLFSHATVSWPGDDYWHTVRYTTDLPVPASQCKASFVWVPLVMAP